MSVKSSSYGQILKSSAVIGGSTGVNLLLGIVRTKFFALLLGPTGVGLLGLYSSVLDLSRTIAGMGISSTGVRQISLAAASNDPNGMAKTVKALRYTAVFLGFLGAICLICLSVPLSRITFGSSSQSGSIAILSIALFLSLVSAGQVALLQGLRRIGDVARVSVLSGLIGTAVSLPIIYVLGETGVAFYLVVVAVATITTSWWFARRAKLPPVAVSWREISSDSLEILKLGFVLMASSMLTLGTAYLIRAMVTRTMGIAEAGFYQAAWAISGLYVGFILQAMGTDFLPRLTAIAENQEECNRTANEQAEVGLLIAVPGVVLVLAFAPLIIRILYSDRFAPAVELLRWFSLGMLLRVASWPLGFILVAKGARKHFLFAELVSNAVYILLIWGGIKALGLVGTGIAFFGFYLVSTVILYVIVRRLSGFRWSARTLQLARVWAPMIVAVLIASYLLSPAVVMFFGAVVAAAAAGYSFRMLGRSLPVERVPLRLRKLLGVMRVCPAP